MPRPAIDLGQRATDGDILRVQTEPFEHHVARLDRRIAFTGVEVLPPIGLPRAGKGSREAAVMGDCAFEGLRSLRKIACDVAALEQAPSERVVGEGLRVGRGRTLQLRTVVR